MDQITAHDAGMLVLHALALIGAGNVVALVGLAVLAVRHVREETERERVEAEVQL